jgi:hypothetical protein
MVARFALTANPDRTSVLTANDSRDRSKRFVHWLEKSDTRLHGNFLYTMPVRIHFPGCHLTMVGLKFDDLGQRRGREHRFHHGVLLAKPGFKGLQIHRGRFLECGNDFNRARERCSGGRVALMKGVWGHGIEVEGLVSL